jgi:hypothetical protein
MVTVIERDGICKRLWTLCIPPCMQVVGCHTNARSRPDCVGPVGCDAAFHQLAYYIREWACMRLVY